MNKTTIINTLKANKAVLRLQFYITSIGLFGSYAQNTFSEKSDIDLVYTLVEGKYLGFLEVYELEQFMQQLFQNKSIDLVNQRYMNPLIADEANKNIVYV